MNSMWTVMQFTMRNKLRSKTFVVMTIILAVLLVVAVLPIQPVRRIPPAYPAGLPIRPVVRARYPARASRRA